MDWRRIVRERRFLSATALFIITLGLYAAALDHSPIYLTHDEVVFALHAESIATTGRDRTGRFLPLYFQVLLDYWAQPVLIYVTALFLKVLPLTEASIRLPSAVVGAINVALLYAIGRRLFGREATALLAAGMLIIAPAHFIHSRVAMDYIYPVPFLLTWMLLMLWYIETRGLMYLCMGVLALAVGFYSYIASVVTMPLFLLLTALLVMRVEGFRVRRLVAAAAVFATPLLLLGVWLLQHPDVYATQVRRYKLYDPSALNPMQGAREFLNYLSLTERTSVYWDFFDPSLLFFSGGSNYVNATRAAGVFLLPTALFLIVGFVRLLRNRFTPQAMTVLGGLLLSPVAATIVIEPYAIDRALGLVPFGVLISAYGVETLWMAAHRVWRVVAVVLLAAMPLQFTHFAMDYFGDYRVRSLYAFERNIRGGVTTLLDHAARSGAPRVYLSEKIAWVDAYWELYARVRRQDALVPRAQVVALDKVRASDMAAGALLLAEWTDPEARAWIQAGLIEELATITEPDGSASFLVARRR
jgi:4-amino-4-deoxy-L-arabinose transferase-like glycosyltransferase